MKQVLVILGVLAISASFIALLSIKRALHEPAEAEDYAHLPKSESPPALFASPDFSFRDHTGQTVTKASLGGQPYVANFIFTTCRTVCPLLTAKMVRLQRELPGLPVRFVSFSVDPEHDTIEALAAYAKQWNPDEVRWSLMETTPPGLADLAKGFHVTADRTDGGLDAVMHSAVFVLVDQYGVVRGVFNSEESDDFKALMRDVRTLVGSKAPEPRPTRSGEVLFHELSCANCHERPELAPPLGGLLGQRRELETRLLVIADEAYLKESIVAPVAKRVAGYPLMMPSYAGHLSMDELDALVKYVVALPPPAAPSPGVEVAIDPVCHMKVRVTPNALRVQPDGGEPHYFCSEWCRARFSENPDAYRH
ncbi:MAG: SCO family protein [Archangium sp.]|nr:SCO family protein [Archangium sp.]